MDHAHKTANGGVALLLLLLVALPSAGAEAAEAGAEAAQTVASLERQVEANPRNGEARDELGRAYYRRARVRLDEKQFEPYEKDLARAMDQWIAALRIAPENPSPHTWMGIAAVYRGDLDGALESFANARRLEPRSWVAHTNIAQTMIYRGNEDGARRFLDRSRRMRADPAVLLLNECLLAWREGDLADAEWLFDEAYRLDPESVSTWDEAPVSSPIRGFDDFTAYCCGNPACGPYMEGACRSAEQDVAKRELPEETARRELQIEMERRRELRRIYEGRQDLRVEIEAEEGGASAAQEP